MLEELSEYVVTTFFLIMCRVLSIVTVMPGIGENYVSPTIRLLLSIAISLVIMPTIESSGFQIPKTQSDIFLAICNELIIGFSIGMLIKIILSIIHTTGTIMSTQSGLSSASMLDPNTGYHGSPEGNFLSAVVLSLIFMMDIHHLIIGAIFSSYSNLHIGKFIDYSSVANAASYYIQQTLLVASKLSAAHLIVGILINLSSSLMTRLMPSIQLMFIIMPIQILASFIVLGLILSSILLWYMDYLKEAIFNIVNIIAK